MTLSEHIKEHEYLGCSKASMGRARIPEGYAIMVDSDGVYTYWLREDGITSCNHRNKWAVLRGAKQDDRGSSVVAETNQP